MKALLLFLPLSAFAAPPPKLGDYLERRLAKVARTLEQLPRDAEPRETLRAEEIYFSLRPHVRFGVSEVARLTVQTQLDFVLTPPESANREDLANAPVTP